MLFILIYVHMCACVYIYVVCYILYATNNVMTFVHTCTYMDGEINRSIDEKIERETESDVQFSHLEERYSLLSS